MHDEGDHLVDEAAALAPEQALAVRDQLEHRSAKPSSCRCAFGHAA